MGDVVACLLCGKRNRVPAASAGRPRCGSCRSDLPWLVSAGDHDFDAVTTTSLPVLVDLWAPWCGPCLRMAPGIEVAAEQLAGQVKVVKVSVDEAVDIASRYDARSIPTLVMLRGGHVLARQVGAMPTERLLSWVRSVLRSSA